MKKIALIITILISAFSFSFANHVLGGEITWQCQSNGQFVFQLRIYRDCNGIALDTSNQSIRVWNYQGLTQISVNLVSIRDISPPCYDSSLSVSCPTIGSGGGEGAVQEFVFQSHPVTLYGTPPNSGWVFTWDGCCRNQAVVNIQNPGSAGATFRAIMYAYVPVGASSANNANPCYDSSPKFHEEPLTIACTGFQFSYHHNATDENLDSLFYAFAQPLDDINLSGWPASSLQFVQGYSISSPLPGPLQNPNSIAASINPNNGSISITNHTAGKFVTCIRVESWRNGQKIAEVFRDFQILFSGTCDTNFPPLISVSSSSSAIPPGTVTFHDTVVAGQFVSFIINALDLDLNIPLQSNSVQMVQMDAIGNQFGTNFTDVTSGCLQPPCATLSSSLPISLPIGVYTQFNWQTSCDHLIGPSAGFHSPPTYNFTFILKDDFCPAPAPAVFNLMITVIADTAGLSIIANGPATLCTGDSVSLSVVNPSGILDYYWFRNGSVIVGSIDSIINVYQGGMYWVITSDGVGGCAQSNYMHVQELSPINLTTINGPTHVSPGIQYIYSSPAYHPSHTVTWNVINGTIVQNINPSTMRVEWGSAGLGVVELTHDNGSCSDSISLQVSFDFGLDETNSSIVHFFPNPSSGVFNLKGEVPITAVTVLDALGREVLRISPNHNRFLIDLSEMSDGIYFVHVFTQDENEVQQLILQK
jgi:hypothetical protein